MAIQLSDAALLVNDEAIGIIPNSLVFTEGLGEQKIRAVSIGGGATEQVFANDLETNYAMVKFDMPTTPENVALARSWKTNGNGNVAQIAGETAEGQLTRTITQAALTADYEIPIGTEANISIEMQGNTAI